MTLLLAPGDRRDAHEAGEVSLDPGRPGRAVLEARLPWGTAVAGWKNSAGR